MPENMFTKIFQPKGKGKLWWIFALVMAIALGAMLVDFGGAYNKAVKNYGLKLPLVKDVPFKLGLDLMGGSQLTYKADISKVATADVASAVEGARDVIERRVNADGVSEPLVQVNRAANGEYRILVELPGVKDISSAIKKIGETPLLEFKEQSANAAQNAEAQKAVDDYNKKAQTKATDNLGKLIKGGDFAAIAKVVSEDKATAAKGGNLGWLNVDDKSVNQPIAEAVVNLTKGQLASDLVETAQGYNIVKLIDKREKQAGDKKITEYNVSRILVAVKTSSAADEWQNTKLTGSNLKRASVQFDPNNNMPQVSLEFDADGAKLFEEVTARNVGKPVAIFLDGFPISVPNVNEKISGGKAVISGKFNVTEAKDLAKRLNAGALPLPIELINQQTIGATLGDSAVHSSLVAGLIGLLLVALFMIVYYRLPGLLSVASLFIYGLIVMAIFKLWPVTLTLPGIAGFIMSIGIAVDANILIFERMKEELRAGRTLTRGIEEGFLRAWPSIRDGNISTIITTIILMIFSTSIIKGFAVTLFLGVLVSLFTAVVVTRNFLRLLDERMLEKHSWLIAKIKK
ncbi:MAG: protein translocase subunit SecD [Candidatus Falkowbacteria bacterium]